ncbi:hypothetical protein ASD15_28960 [Massilia sp. Root351]|jgi:ABC-type amino acid transport substrate-binding protein|uniref:hypothetical protein n=1 Tax=Massilia sp. Root351 TaxID=1736522 RepID=UPI000710F2FC|nr:hypothetical protein [Massilia sp. Root351]KQV86625.1 hypothetical protein ASD15_28960 [Massilia sp. Root351]
MMKAIPAFLWRSPLLLLAVAPLHAAPPLPPLRFLVVDGHGMPLAQPRTGTAGQRSALGPGIIKKWQDALAAELGRTPVNLVLPRKRQDQAVANRQVDLRCFVSPEWLPAELAAQYEWPQAFMEVEERIIGNADAAPVQRMADLHGKRIGTVHGYQYRKLAPLFDAGSAWRDDAPSEAALLAKQLAGRTDVSVMRTLDFAYLKLHDPRLARLALAPLAVSRFSLYCARTHYSSVTLAQLQLAQQRLLQGGILEKILQSYR